MTKKNAPELHPVQVGPELFQVCVIKTDTLDADGKRHLASIDPGRFGVAGLIHGAAFPVVLQTALVGALAPLKGLGSCAATLEYVNGAGELRRMRLADEAI